MRVTVGAMTVLGLSVAVAAAQPRPRERAAVLKPPQALRAGSGSIVARGVSDDFPPSTFLPSTPVARPYDAPAVGRSSAWLSGVDPNVLPAAGSSTNAGGVRTLTPAPQPKDEPSIFAKGLEKLKGIGSGRDKPAPPPQPSARPAAPPAAQPRPLEQPTAATPYRGTAANGAPVYAGPPAYRWYGWGSVTPGANPLAPAGQYPKASANWYSITGATPGAFPVPVMNPLRQPPGTEPPNYTATRPQPHPVVPAASYPVPPQPGERPAQPTYNRPAESKFMPAPHPMPAPPATTFLPAPAVGVAPPAPAFLPPPVSVPTITAPPMLKPIAVVPPLPPALVAVAEPTPITPPGRSSRTRTHRGAAAGPGPGGNHSAPGCARRCAGEADRPRERADAATHAGCDRHSRPAPDDDNQRDALAADNRADTGTVRYLGSCRRSPAPSATSQRPARVAIGQSEHRRGDCSRSDARHQARRHRHAHSPGLPGPRRGCRNPLDRYEEADRVL